MSTLYVDTINEKTSGNGVQIPNHVVQVVRSELAQGAVQTASTSFVATGLTTTITPKYSNSKFIIQMQGGGLYNGQNGSTAIYCALYRKIGTGSFTNITNATYGFMRYSGTSGAWVIAPISGSVEDTPNTASQLQYQVYFRSQTAVTQDFNGTDRGFPSMIVTEIAQ